MADDALRRHLKENYEDYGFYLNEDKVNPIKREIIRKGIAFIERMNQEKQVVY